MSSCPSQAHFWPATAASGKCLGRSRLGKALATLEVKPSPLISSTSWTSWELRETGGNLATSLQLPTPAAVPAPSAVLASEEPAVATSPRSPGGAAPVQGRPGAREPLSLFPSRQRGRLSSDSLRDTPSWGSEGPIPPIPSVPRAVTHRRPGARAARRAAAPVARRRRRRAASRERWTSYVGRPPPLYMERGRAGAGPRPRLGAFQRGEGTERGGSAGARPGWVSSLGESSRKGRGGALGAGRVPQAPAPPPHPRRRPSWAWGFTWTRLRSVSLCLFGVIRPLYKPSLLFLE